MEDELLLHEKYELVEENGYFVIVEHYNDGRPSAICCKFYSKETAIEKLNHLIAEDSRTNEDKINELDEIRGNIETKYSEDVQDIFSVYYNENTEDYEIIYNDDTFFSAGTLEEAEQLVLLFDVLYEDALTEGIMIGVNHPDFGINLLREKNELNIDDVFIG